MNDNTVPVFHEDKMMANLHRSHQRSECLANWQLAERKEKMHQPTKAQLDYEQHAREKLATLRASYARRRVHPAVVLVVLVTAVIVAGLVWHLVGVW